MRYVPNLIPQTSKVLPDYFKGDVCQLRHENRLFTHLGWVAGAFFLIGALVSIQHPFMSFAFGLLGFILLPPGHRWLEKKFRFSFKMKPKAIFASALLIASFLLADHYSDVDKKVAYQQKLIEETEKEEQLLAEQKKHQLKDSLNYYLQTSEELANKHKPDEAVKKLEYALEFASTTEDKSLISNARISIFKQRTFDLVRAGKYKAALPELNFLLSHDVSNTDLRYIRAICYSKTGNILEAVADCKAAIQDGNKDAEKLYDNINPIRKRVVDYLTRCCDGTLSPSNAKGRGACSHHGGVCDWNEPLYEEYRKYK